MRSRIARLPFQGKAVRNSYFLRQNPGSRRARKPTRGSSFESLHLVPKLIFGKSDGWIFLVLCPATLQFQAVRQWLRQSFRVPDRGDQFLSQFQPLQIGQLLEVWDISDAHAINLTTAASNAKPNPAKCGFLAIYGHRS